MDFVSKFTVFMVARLCHFVFSFVVANRRQVKRRKYVMRKDEKNAKRKDEITSCERTKPATRKDEISARKDEKKKKNAMRKDAIWNFNFVVFSGGVFSFFRMASFRLFIWHYSSFRHEKAEWHKPATIVFIILSKTQNKLKVLFCIIYVLFFAEVFLLWLLLLFFYLILSWVVWLVLFYF